MQPAEEPRTAELKDDMMTNGRQAMDGRMALCTAAIDTFRYGAGGTSSGELKNNKNIF